MNHAVRAAHVCSLIACVLAFAASVGPALADDSLTVVGGSTPTGFFEVLDLVAQQAGFFKDEHLIVDKQYSGNASIAAQLVATGKADIGSLAIEPILLGYEKGLRLTAIFARDPHSFQTMAVLDGSPIKTLADFKGTTIGEYTAGSAGELPANSELAGAGLKRSDYTYLPIGSGAQAISAMTSGKVAGVAFPYPELVTYEAVAGLKFRYFWHPILKDIPDATFISSPVTLQTKSALVGRFLRAIVKAAILVRENPQLAAKYFVTGSGAKVTGAAIALQARLLSLSQDMIAGYDPTSKRIGELPLRGMNVLARFLFDNGLTAQLVPASAIVSNQFIDYANDFDHKAFIAQVRAMR
jgi:NitT/TauT family transport system substrate-binding protein